MEQNEPVSVMSVKSLLPRNPRLKRLNRKQGEVRSDPDKKVVFPPRRSRDKTKQIKGKNKISSKIRADGVFLLFGAREHEFSHPVNALVLCLDREMVGFAGSSM